jgi:anti-anti-sigma regulatory factor
MRETMLVYMMEIASVYSRDFLMDSKKEIVLDLKSVSLMGEMEVSKLVDMRDFCWVQEKALQTVGRKDLYSDLG